MNISRLLMVATVLIGLSTSCADTEKSPTILGTPVSFKLTLSSPQTTRTAITTDPNSGTYGNEGTMNNAVVGLFDAAGSLVAKQSFTSTQLTGSQVSITGTNQVTQAAVAVNVPAASFANVKTLSGFESVQANLDNTATADASAAGTALQYATALPMSGESPVTITSSTGTAAVSLTRLVSRITLTGFNTSFPGAANGESFALTEVFMYNAASTANCKATSAFASSPTWLQGEQVAPIFQTTNLKNYLGTGDLTGKTLPSFNSFYVFPDSTKASRTELVIKGIYKASSGDVGTTVYYPIAINKSASNVTFTGTTGSNKADGTDGVVLNNKIYSISATITAKGVSDPTQTFTNSVTAPVTVTMSVNSWGATTNQNTNFGPVDAITPGTTYLYSDGTWGTAIPASTANPHVIGVVFSGATSAADQRRGWSHGYALALKNAKAPTAGVAWGAQGTSDPTTTYTTLWTDLRDDKNGYTETKYIQTNRTPTASSYPAFYYALNYGTTNVAGTTTYAAPTSGTSGWYLPSYGQFYDICVNLGGMSATPTNTSSANISWSNSTNTFSSLCANGINTPLNNLKTQGYTVDTFTNSNEFYWDTAQFDVNYANGINFNSTGDMQFNGPLKGSAGGVRSVIAF